MSFRRVLPVRLDVDDIVYYIDAAGRKNHQRTADYNARKRIDVKELGVEHDSREDKQNILRPLSWTHCKDYGVEYVQNAHLIVRARHGMWTDDNVSQG